MEAKELMIGDWVLHEGEPYQIRQLGIYGVDRDGEDYPAVCVGKPKGIGLIVERNEIEPIPITPEILEKNGFKVKEPESNFKYVTTGRKYTIEFLFFGEAIHGVSTVMDCEVVFSGGLDRIHKCNVKYVHELQHALKLCGIEKEIELL